MLIDISINFVFCLKFQTLLFSASLGRVIGALAVLTGEPSMFTVKSKTESEVVLISKMDFYSYVKENFLYAVICVHLKNPARNFIPVLHFIFMKIF